MLFFLVVDLGRAVRETRYLKCFLYVWSVSGALQAIIVHCDWRLGLDLVVSRLFI